MIIPDSPLYQTKSDEEFRALMIEHIKDVYSDSLGEDVKLIDLPNGLELLQNRVQQRLYEMSRGEIDIRTKSFEDQVAA